MSSSEVHRQSKRVKCLCAACRERKARFKYRGEVRADRDHPPSLSELRRGTTVCFECYRAAINRARARRMTETAKPLVPLWMPSPFGQQGSDHGRILKAAQLALRLGMLDHLQRPSAVAP